MFMFQSFSFAAFIPEIIMVLAYVFCLCGQTKTVEKTDIVTDESKIVKAHFKTSSSVYYFDQQYIQPAENTIQKSIDFSLSESSIIPYQNFCRLTDCLSFVQFSRPPPSFLI